MILRAPVSVQWEVTEFCNKNCIFCYNYWRKDENDLNNKTPNTVNTQNIQSVVKQLIENEVFSVTITGGEPLLVFKELVPYIKELHDSGISVALNSNLTMATKEMLSQMYSCGIRKIICSLPAHNDEVHYQIAGTKTFKDTVNGLKNAIDSGFDVSVNMVVCKYNVEYVLETAKLAHSVGAKKFFLNPVLPSLNDKHYSTYAISLDELSRLLPDMIKIENDLHMRTGFLEAIPFCMFDNIDEAAMHFFGKRCMAGVTFCTIGANGQIRSCFMEDKEYGSDLQSAWDIIQKDAQKTDKSECTDCPQISACQGGCRILRKRMPSVFEKPHIDFLKNAAKNSLTEEPIQSDLFNSYYRFSSQIKARNEEFGGVFYIHGKSYYIDNAVYSYFKNNKDTVFNGELFHKTCGYAEDFALKVLRFLLAKNIIEVTAEPF